VRPLSSGRLIERPALRRPSARDVAGDFGTTYAVNGLIGLVFATTGPLAIILAVGTRGGLSQAELASWIFGSYALSGVLTVIASWVYRQPLSFFWTIPGTVLVGPALDHLSWAEVVGAFLATGVLMLLLGLTGWVRRVMDLLPMPIVMAMVAAVFLRFGIDLVLALVDDPVVAVPMVVAFLALSTYAALSRRIPPILGALVVGAVAVALAGSFDPSAGGTTWVVQPVFTAPDFSWPAMVELVVPLAITVLVVQNGQGVAVLRQAGHEPPVNAITVGCGAWSVMSAMVGAVSTCLTGPTNALLTASGERSRHYTAGIFCGVLAIVFGVFAPLFTGLMLATPTAFIAALGGLAMLRALQGSFVTAFAGRFTLGALVTFLVTVADVQVLNIGAAFWGLVAGYLVSRLMEPHDFGQHHP
jgi:benzoate membrane transport protein